MLRSSIWVTALSLLGSALRLANQLLMAYRFGASRTVDAFLIALSVPTFVGGLISTIVSFSVVPRVVAVSGDRDRHAAYVQAMMLAILATGTVVAVAGSILSPFLARIGGPSYVDGSTLAMARVAWAGTAVTIVLGYLGAVSNAATRFIEPSVAGLGPYIGMLTANYFLGARYRDRRPSNRPGRGRHGRCGFARPLPSRDLAGPAAIATPVARRLGVPRLDRCTAVAMTIFSVFTVVDARLAPQLGEANLAYLGYSQRIVIALGNLAIAGPSAVLVPHFARAIAEGRRSDFVRDTVRAIALVAGVAAVLAVGARFFAADLVRLAFQRGAFRAQDVSQLTNVLSVLLLGMIPMLSVVILFRAVFCMGTTRPPAVAALLWVTLYFGTGTFLAPRFQAVGMAYAYLLSWVTVLAAGLVWFFWTARTFARDLPAGDEPGGPTSQAMRARPAYFLVKRTLDALAAAGGLLLLSLSSSPSPSP